MVGLLFAIGGVVISSSFVFPSSVVAPSSFSPRDIIAAKFVDPLPDAGLFVGVVVGDDN